MSKLPAGWVLAYLDQIIVKIIGGGTPSKTNVDYFRGTKPFMTVKDMRERFPIDTIDHISEDAINSSATSIVPADTLIIATRMSLGKIVRPKFDTAINQDLKALFLADGINKTFVEHWWRSRAAYIVSLGTGTTVKGIRLEDIRNLQINLPPLNEQKRIADKLDRILARVDACRERLDRIPAILKRFRQAVLAAATSGKLTEEWREEKEIEQKWTATDIQSIAKVGTGSTPLRSNFHFYSTDGTPWITSSATANPFVYSAEEFVTEAAIAAHRLKIYPIGTLLVAMYGEGKTRGQVTELRIAATINQACAAIVVNEVLVDRAFIKLVLQANYLQMRFLAEGGNQPNLNLSKIKKFPLLLPDLQEQTEIVRRVEELFAYADRIEARYHAARAQVEKLTPAILAKAFRGELAPQDPNDEPASVLLERIQAARAKEEVAVKSRRSRNDGAK